MARASLRWALVRQPQVGGVEQCRNRDRRQGNRPTIIDKPHQPALLPQGLRRQIAVVGRTHHQPQALLLTGHKVAVGLTAVGEYRLGSAVLLVAHPHGLGNGSAGADRRAMALPDPVGPLAFVARAVTVVKHALAVLEVVAPSPLVLQTVVALWVAVDAKALALALGLVALEGGPISQGLAHLAAGPIVYSVALLLCLLRFPSQGSPLAATVNVLVDYRRVVVVVAVVVVAISLVVVAAAGEQPARQPEPAREDAEEAMQDVVRHGCCVVLVWKSTKPGAQRQAPAIGPTLAATLLHHFSTRIAVIVGPAPN